MSRYVGIWMLEWMDNHSSKDYVFIVQSFAIPALNCLVLIDNILNILLLLLNKMTLIKETVAYLRCPDIRLIFRINKFDLLASQILPSQAMINSALNPCALLRFFEDLSFYFVELQNRPRVHVLKANKLELARCHFNLVGVLLEGTRRRAVFPSYVSD